MKILITSILTLILSTALSAQEPLRLAVAGLSHGHVHWVFNRGDITDYKLVSIYEENQELAKEFQERYNLDPKIFYTDLEKMLDEVKPEAISAFGAISEHVGVVRASAPRRIHVMVEKPLATTYKDAREIQRLATENSIYVLTNFETSWYASNQYLKKMVDNGKVGLIRKVLVNDGHQGPKEIGVGDEFFEILTNPDKSGAGALYDFGCYGANLMTWLQGGEKPISVTAVVNQNKPEIYNQVDDEATIILQYPKSQCIIQASWNWPFNRKDMTVYGTNGYIIAKDAMTVVERLGNQDEENLFQLTPRQNPFDNPFSYLAAVISREIILPENGLYNLPVNVTTVQILEAAKRSTKTNATVFLD